MRKYLLYYLGMLLAFGVGIYGILEYGAHLQPDVTVPAQRAELAGTPQPPKPEASAGGIGKVFHENLRHPLSVLLLQVIVIVVAARLSGSVFLRLGQPAVTGEIVAGILLGPSLLGMLFPEAQAFLFPAPSMTPLQLLSQIGVILFMFVVGIEMDLPHLRQKAHTAVLVSHASIVIPFFLGTAFSLLLYRTLAPPHISFSAFALFMGIAMSITAFPVLARIIEERGLSQSPLGNIAIACAAVDDVTAWCILAMVVAIVQADGLGSALLTIGLALLFSGAMLFLVKPLIERLGGRDIGTETRSKGRVAGILTLVFAAALFTEVIGIHALFGAFLAGAMLSSNDRLRRFLKERLETFSGVFLLPLFFAFTGLRTQLGLLNDEWGWVSCLGIIAVAIAGKLGGSALAARWIGMSWRDSLALGALMNTRGLIELIVLNIGYDLGILSPRIFTMMVIMALVTTFMTGPLLSLLHASKRKGDVLVEDPV